MKISVLTTSLLLALSGSQLAYAQSSLNQTFDACSTQLTAQIHYQCVPKIEAGNDYQFSLVNAPDGMAIQPKTGIIKWTPLNHQVNSSGWNVKVKNNGEEVSSMNIFVDIGEGKDPKGVYVSTSGNDDTADGSAKTPFATLTAAAQYTKRNELPLRIYLRGGVYQDFSSNQGSMLRIQDRHGEAQKWNFIRPVGNEYVKIESTRDVISVARSSYLSIENLQLDGKANGVTIDKVMPYWWTDGRAVNPYKNRGLSANNSEHIRYSGNIIHDFSGGAISNNYNDHIEIENNIVFRNAWWSTAGTHGISNSKTGNDKSHLTPDEVKYTISGNLVFSNASLIASHVFSKGFVTLAIDEGNGIHLQNNHGTYSGHASVTNNLAIYNGRCFSR